MNVMSAPLRFFLLFATIVLAMSLQAKVYAADNTAPISEEQALHTDLVLLAMKSDFYNRRCRGISVAKNFNKVNRLFITKYSLTANNYIKQYINPDVRQEKEIQEREFKKELNRVGGCNAARKNGWRSEISDLFHNLYQQAQKSTWFPEEI